MTPLRSGQRGFSLVELLVAILIVVTILGITQLSWKTLLPDQKLHTAVRNLSETLYGTRSDAIARNREFRIYYDLDAERYWVETPFRVGGGFATTEDEERVLTHEADLGSEGVVIEEVTIDDETYQDGVVYVRFDPLGASSHHRIVLRQDIFERVFTIEVLPLTGDIRFHDGYFEREIPLERDFR